MTVTQSAFNLGLFDPILPTPAGLCDPQGRPAGKRFDVYRNNVIVGLSDALSDCFPVIQKLIGEQNFSGLAGIFVRAHPPTSSLMMFYGDAFAEFLASFEPFAHLGYLPDVARLELAIRRSYHAADSSSITPQELQALPTERLLAASLAIAPAVQVVQSEWPILAIWRFNMVSGAENPAMASEDVLITRPGFDPDLSLLPQNGAAFIRQLSDGVTFGTVLDQAGEIDLSAMLELLLKGRAITRIIERDRL